MAAWTKKAARQAEKRLAQHQQARTYGTAPARKAGKQAGLTPRVAGKSTALAPKR
jgi:hypothetical protein